MNPGSFNCLPINSFIWISPKRVSSLLLGMLFVILISARSKHLNVFEKGYLIVAMLNKNTWGVKKCGANQKQHCKQAGATKRFDISFIDPCDPCDISFIDQKALLIHVILKLLTDSDVVGRLWLFSSGILSRLIYF